MSRYTVTVSKGTNIDSDAVLGFDPPLRTFFLQAFPHEQTDEYALWLGTLLETYPSLESIISAARDHGYEIRGLDQKTIIALIEESSCRLAAKCKNAPVWFGSSI